MMKIDKRWTMKNSMLVHVLEDMTLNMSMSKLCETLSLQKAQEVFDKTNGDRVVIGSDCMVSIKGKRLGKPHSREDAVKMLKLLSSRWHSVYTGLCVIIEKNGQIKKYITHDISKVKFKKSNYQYTKNIAIYPIYIYH